MAYDKKAANRKWYENNTEKHRAACARWQAANLEKALAYKKQYREATREKYRYYWRKRDLKRKFGMTTEDYGNMLLGQDGLCAICWKPAESNRDFAVDHCHVSGKIRGLLCQPCNVSIGQFHDDPNLLLRASAYLKETL